MNAKYFCSLKWHKNLYLAIFFNTGLQYNRIFDLGTKHGNVYFNSKKLTLTKN